MKLFQLITFPLLTFLLLRSLWELFRRGRPLRPHIFAVFVWSLALIAIARPEWTSRIAVSIGIGRGADLLLYALAIMFLLICFHFYHRTSQLQSQITRLNRYLAIEDGLRKWDKSMTAEQEQSLLSKTNT